jgi:hypothetical protein
MDPCSSNRIALELVVPWSRAKINFFMNCIVGELGLAMVGVFPRRWAEIAATLCTST